MMKRIISVFIMIVCAAALVIWSKYNYTNNATFLQAPVSSIATIAVALFVSYFLVQQNTDQRKKKDCIEKVLHKIEAQISLPILYDISYDISNDKERSELLSHKRAIQNKITFLGKYKGKYISKHDYSELNKKLAEYDELLSSHMQDKDFLSKAKTDLQRPLLLMDDIIDKINIELWK